MASVEEVPYVYTASHVTVACDDDVTVPVGLRRVREPSSMHAVWSLEETLDLGIS